MPRIEPLLPTTSLNASAYTVEFKASLCLKDAPASSSARETRSESIKSAHRPLLLTLRNSLHVSAYNWCMVMAGLAIRSLVFMFFLGMAGAAIVVLISFFEDFKELFGGEQDQSF